ncbi:MAG TPA: MmcQ/YjbR family DNA-binding protein [Gemmataceae bacterium]|nr:MmcQ/YjbR family DNA-binding protein [Gemmataceae bacterium]
MAARNPLARAFAALRKCALAYPDAHEDFPWGESAFKVNGKLFLFLHRPDGGLSATVKLPESGEVARALPFAEPSGYGLGKSGWVTARFDKSDDVPVEMLVGWVDESFRAVAPKRLVAKLEAEEED